MSIWRPGVAAIAWPSTRRPDAEYPESPACVPLGPASASTETLRLPTATRPPTRRMLLAVAVASAIPSGPVPPAPSSTPTCPTAPAAPCSPEADADRAGLASEPATALATVPPSSIAPNPLEVPRPVSPGAAAAGSTRAAASASARTAGRRMAAPAEWGRGGTRGFYGPGGTGGTLPAGITRPKHDPQGSLQILSPTLRTTTLLAALALLLTLVVTSHPSLGAPADIRAKRAQIRAIQAQLARLDDKVERAAEAYNGARYHLGLVQRR